MNFQLPQIREDDLENREEIRRILEALYQLSEQIRYFSYNIGEENLSDELKNTLTGQQMQLSQLNRELKNGITGTMSLIRQQSDLIALMVSSEIYTHDLEDLMGLIAENTSAITQNAEQISLKVSQSVYDEKTEELDGQYTELLLKISNDKHTYLYNNIEATYFADEKLVISYNGSQQKVELGVNGEDPYISIIDEDGDEQLRLTKSGIGFGGGSQLIPFTVGTLSGLAIFA